MLKRICAFLLVAMIACSLTACGGYKIPKDWVIMPREEAESLYHSVDFTAENIADYLEFTTEVAEQYNDWGELHKRIYYNGIKFSAENFIRYHTPDDEFLMDVSYTLRERYVQLDPQTLEEIGEQGLFSGTYERSYTVGSLRFNGFLLSDYYYIDYNSDGTPILDNKGELWVMKREILNWKVERVRGHAEWIADIPDKYYMTTKSHTPPEGALEGANMTFVVIEGKDYYYCYEDYGNVGSYQTSGYEINGNGWFCMGNCISFVRGREY